MTVLAQNCFYYPRRRKHILLSVINKRNNVKNILLVNNKLHEILGHKMEPEISHELF